MTLQNSAAPGPKRVKREAEAGAGGEGTDVHPPHLHEHGHGHGAGASAHSFIGFALVTGFVFMLIVDQVASLGTRRGERHLRG